MQVLGISTTTLNELGSNLEDKSASPPRLQLHGRITVSDQDGSFDTVRIRLRGAIRTRIGGQVAVEKLPPSTELRSNLDFKPVYSASQPATDEQHLDFVCPIPFTKDRQKSSFSERGLGGRTVSSSPSGMLNAFVPSLQISGSTYITRVTALTDRHVVRGSCDVVYWLEAELLRSGSRDSIRKLTCAVDVSSLAMPMEVEVSSPSNDLDHVEQLAKPQQMRPIHKFFTSQTRARLSVHIPKRLGYLRSDSSSLATGCRRLSIPVTVDVDLPPPSNSSQQQEGRESTLMQTQGLKCSVRAKWFTRKTFTTGPPAPESVINNTTVSTQDLVMTLPPLYSNSPVSIPNLISPTSASHSNYSTSMDLDLLLPQSVACPSVSTELLDIVYTLDLSLKFESDGLSKGPYVANFSLPVTVRSARPYSTVGRHCFDPLLGYIEEDDEELLCAPPVYVP
ncbi:hypothetical protein A1O3_03503 [Capronia epimyces CBS 606.96]|uniref:Uncharacterized protein n=1 Tax=Capronia epimyces CBS 606.96 TaxID=1182542 RepID=W9YA76_9EURO|nr:uncharacterized protein A1O3_03503 [Capronia epimyces CBS 606.96]EXJ86550.1 hypothetical protein A1O3_03503 [Capronia epimyces CBS 606.96]